MMRVGVAIVAALALLGAACSSSNNNGGQAHTHTHATSDSPVALSTGAAASPAPGAHVINVTLNEYSVALDAPNVTAGPVRLVVKNTGQRGHQVQVYLQSAVAGGHAAHMGAGGLVEGAAGLLPLVPPGETMNLDVMLTPGAWEIACHLQDSDAGQSFDHYDKGMRAPLTVGAAQ